MCQCVAFVGKYSRRPRSVSVWRCEVRCLQCSLYYMLSQVPGPQGTVPRGRPNLKGKSKGSKSAGVSVSVWRCEVRCLQCSLYYMLSKCQAHRGRCRGADPT